MKKIIILAISYLLGLTYAKAGVCDTVCNYTASKTYFVASGVTDADTFLWTATNGITISSVSGVKGDSVVVNFTAATPGMDTVKVTPRNGCGLGTMGMFIVYVQATPPKPNAGTDFALCSGATINLTSSAAPAGGTYSWTGPGGFTSALQNPTRASSTTAMSGNYIVQHTVNGCMGTSDTVAVTVNQTPSAGVDQASICGGTDITVTGTNPTTGSWTALGTNPAGATTGSTTAGVATVNFATTASGSYSFIYTTTGSCSDTMIASVTNKPNAGTDITGTCGGGNSTLTGTSPTTGTWTAEGSNPAGATLGSTTAGVAGVSFATTASGTYSFIYTAGGCTDTMTVSATSKPSAGTDITGVCGGGSSTLTGTSPTTGTWTAEASNPAGATLGSTTAGVASASFATSASGTYSFIYTAAGCTDTMTVSATSKPSAGADQSSLCGGTSATLTGTTPTSGSWTALGSNPAGATLGTTTAGVASVTFTPAASGTFNFIYTAGGCTDTMSVGTNAKPNAPNASPDTVVCLNSARLLTVTGDAGASFTWTKPNATTATGNFLNIPTAGIVDSGKYYVTQTVAGCTSLPDSVVVQVITPPTIAAGTVVNPTTCAGSNGSFAITGLKPGTSYRISYTGPSSASNVVVTSDVSGVITIGSLAAGTYSSITVNTMTGSCNSNSLASIVLTGPVPTGTPVIFCK